MITPWHETCCNSSLHDGGALNRGHTTICGQLTQYHRGTGPGWNLGRKKIPVYYVMRRFASNVPTALFLHIVLFYSFSLSFLPSLSRFISQEAQTPRRERGFVSRWVAVAVRCDTKVCVLSCEGRCVRAVSSSSSRDYFFSKPGREKKRGPCCKSDAPLSPPGQFSLSQQTNKQPPPFPLLPRSKHSPLFFSLPSN